LIGSIAGVDSVPGLLRWDLLIFGLYFTFPANLLIYGVNDIYDYETDVLNDKKAGYETLVTPVQRPRLWLAIAVVNLPFIVASLAYGAQCVSVLSIFLFLSIFYSAPPIRAKAKALLDSAFNALYIMPGIFAYVVTSGTYPGWEIVTAGCLWTAAMHAYSAIPDIAADREAGLKTVATALGARMTLALCLVLFVSASVLSASRLGLLSIGLGGGYALLILASYISLRRGRLFDLYRRFPVVNMTAGFVLFWHIALYKL
jgi:4-hydroxybenzoate polyprenyltransferase